MSCKYCTHNKVSNVLFLSFSAFRMIPYPLEKGHLFYPYPICTETADRELLPCKSELFLFFIPGSWHQRVVYHSSAILASTDTYEVGFTDLEWLADSESWEFTWLLKWQFIATAHKVLGICIDVKKEKKSNYLGDVLLLKICCFFLVKTDKVCLFLYLGYDTIKLKIQLSCPIVLMRETAV